MDPYFDISLSEAFDVLEQEIYLPIWEMDSAPDQLMFENLELSIEQPISSEQDIYADGICRTMDFIEEASIEHQQPNQRFFLLDGMIDKLDADIESQVITPEASCFETMPEPVPKVFGSFESEADGCVC